MIELVDSANFEVVGFKYNDDEYAAAIFSLGIYGTQLALGRVMDKGKTYETAVEVTERMTEAIQGDLKTLNLKHHIILRNIYFPFTVGLHSGIRTTYQYEALCKTLGVRPFELMSNAMTARRILEESSITQEFVDFDLDSDR